MMVVYLPHTIEQVLDVLSDQPGTGLLAGGTDMMVEINYRHRKFKPTIALRHVNELRQWRRDGDMLTIGACVTFTEIMHSELAVLAPALAQAARTVGSPQIRNTGTIGGNIATASPAGDSLPVLAAEGALVTLRKQSGQRRVPIQEFITGVKTTSLSPDELIESVTLPVARGPQEFLKIGKRNAMVIAVANLALTVDQERGRIQCAIGAVGPKIIRCTEAEAFFASEVHRASGSTGNGDHAQEFGALCAKAAVPIDDHRSSAAYRQHAISIMAQRALRRVQ